MKDSKIKNALKRNHQKSTLTQVKPSKSYNLYGLFVHELRDIYGAEKALTKAIPKMVNQSSSDELKESLKFHFETTKGHLSLLEEVFYSINEKVMTNTCEGMNGILREADEIMVSSEKGEVRDAGIIAACQKAEHYEIATYGTLCSFANTLEADKAAAMLHQICDDEIEMDEKLTRLAKSYINANAAGNVLNNNDVTIVPVLVPF